TTCVPLHPQRGPHSATGTHGCGGSPLPRAWNASGPHAATLEIKCVHLAHRLLVRFPRDNVCVHMPAHDIRVHREAEARIARAIAEARVLAYLHRHERFGRRAGVVTRRLLQTLPLAAGEAAKGVASVELDVTKVVHFGHEIERACGHAHAEPGLFQRLEHVAL